MFGGYQETSRESVVTSVSVGQSGGEAAEQKGWKGREWKRISRLNTAKAGNTTITARAYGTKYSTQVGYDTIGTRENREGKGRADKVFISSHLN